MAKKIILIILLLLSPSLAHAGFWSSVGACFTDPCNCGDKSSTRWEDWNNQHLNKGKKNSLCPPWNKTGGRDNHTCLVKSSFPQAFINYYENLCGEETPESTYLAPKIRVRGQQCNAIACWTTTNTLNWNGECATLAGAYGLPLHRMCARIAIPADYAANFPQDPGYTPKIHLNFEGATVPDEIILGYDGQPIDFNPPKLCLYSDPAFLSFSDGFDLMDLNPNRQPSHKTTELHPVVKVILFFADIASQSSQTPFQLLDALFNMLSSGDEGQTTFISVLKDLFDFLGWLIQKIGNTFIAILREIGQINRAVDSTIFGCVNLPMGPYPPPFCSVVAPFFQTAYTQKICRRDSTGALLSSIESEQCVVSTLENNFVRNAVRITFENFVPLCGPGVAPTSDKCIAINNLGVFGSASGLHTATGKTDILPACIDAPAGTTCINTTIVHSCSVSANGCQSGFRVVYGMRLGDTFTPQSYFRDDLADCPANSSVACQDIWGINTAEFVDIALTFPAVQVVPDITPLIQAASLQDKTGRAVNFVGSIVRVSSFDPVTGFTQDPKQICVTQDAVIAGCEDRAPFTKPQVYDCSSPGAPVSCLSSYFSPQFIATVTVGSDSTSAVVKPSSVYDIPASNSTEPVIINLAGYNFSSFVTDDSFAKEPFSGPKSPNPGSLYGTYKDNIPPVNAKLVENPNAIYLQGLEYINGNYHLGGKYACLENLDLEKCPSNVTSCVLSNLLNRNMVNCENFLAKLAQYNNLGLCTASQSSSCKSVVDGLPGAPSGPGISIRSCGGGVYCYTSPGNIEVCGISTLASDRYLPSPGLGAVLSDSQYYDINNVSPGYNYDKSQYSLRDKTSYEMNLCMDIPQPKCAATESYDKDNGFAAWPETTVGDIAIGSCKPGGTPLAPLQRRCVPDPENKTFHFEPLYSWDRSGVFPIKVYGNVKCQYPR